MLDGTGLVDVDDDDDDEDDDDDDDDEGWEEGDKGEDGMGREEEALDVGAVRVLLLD